MIRSVWAILAGFVLIGILAFGSDAIMRAMSPWAYDANGATTNTAILVVSLLNSAVFGLVGCYLTARLAPSKPMKHALILGVLGVITTCAATAMLWDQAPAWFNIMGVLIVLPLAWLAGRLRETELTAKDRAVSV